MTSVPSQTCTECGAEVLILQYRDEDGWRCNRCTPSIRSCKNHVHGIKYLLCVQGCPYIDSDKKCESHEAFFCEQNTKCPLCQDVVSRGLLAEHYATSCKVEKYKSRSSWKVTRAWGMDCLVESPAGIAVCRNFLNGITYDLYVHIPVQSEQLKEFYSTVQINEPDSGDELFFTPDAVYDNSMDWHIAVNKYHFGSWAQELDVSVDIVNIN